MSPWSHLETRQSEGEKRLQCFIFWHLQGLQSSAEEIFPSIYLNGCRARIKNSLTAITATSGVVIGARQYLWSQWYWVCTKNNKVKVLFWLRGRRFRVWTWTCFSSRHRQKRRGDHIHFTIQGDYTPLKSRDSRWTLVWHNGSILSPSAAGAPPLPFTARISSNISKVSRRMLTLTCRPSDLHSQTGNDARKDCCCTAAHCSRVTFPCEQDFTFLFLFLTIKRECFLIRLWINFTSFLGKLDKDICIREVEKVV